MNLNLWWHSLRDLTKIKYPPPWVVSLKDETYSEDTITIKIQYQPLSNFKQFNKQSRTLRTHTDHDHDHDQI